jgi:threonyl-tRNA synthetase
MRSIIQSKVDFVRKEVSAEEAKKIFSDQPYKLELIAGLEEGNVDEDGNPTDEKPAISIYSQGGFTDLCRGPHVKNSSEINPQAIKLLSVAGAYWRGDEKRPMLQRIYGTAWNKPDELKDYLWRIEEAKKRDHRKAGQELDLFTRFDETKALVGFHLASNGWKNPQDNGRFSGAKNIESNGNDLLYASYRKSKLWKTSGHLGFIKKICIRHWI